MCDIINECERINELSLEALELELDEDVADMQLSEMREFDIALLGTIRDGLEQAAEGDTSLLNAFKEPLIEINIDTSNNTTALADINKFMEAVNSTENLKGKMILIGGALLGVILGLGIAVAVAVTGVVGTIIGIAIPIALLFPMIKLGKSIAANIGDAKAERSGKNLGEPKNPKKAIKTLPTSEAFKRVDELTKFCKFIESKASTMKADDILAFVNSAKQVGYQFKDDKLSPKHAITLKLIGIQKAGWTGPNVEKLEDKLLALGEILTKFDKVVETVKTSLEAAKKAAENLSDADKEKAKADVDKTKSAMAFCKQYSKAVFRDTRIINRVYNVLLSEF